MLHVGASNECSASEFLCRTTEGIRCLPNMYKCDSVKDCEDNEDEENCPDSELPDGGGSVQVKSRFNVLIW